MLNGKVDISRIRASSDRDDYMQISLVDESSHLKVVNINITLVAFVNALTGVGQNDCTFKLIGDRELIGKMKEAKTELLNRDNAENELSTCEINGWMCPNKTDIDNVHRWRAEDKVEVSFVRYV